LSSQVNPCQITPATDNYFTTRNRVRDVLQIIPGQYTFCATVQF